MVKQSLWMMVTFQIKAHVRITKHQNYNHIIYQILFQIYRSESNKIREKLPVELQEVVSYGCLTYKETRYAVDGT